MSGEEVQGVGKFKYLGVMMRLNGGIGKEVAQRGLERRKTWDGESAAQRERRYVSLRRAERVSEVP